MTRALAAPATGGRATTGDAVADPANPPRVVLVTGKGGVGKTTTAAALAVASARGGLRTLLMSTDVASSLGDVLGVPVPRARHWADVVEVESGLQSQAIGSHTEAGADWAVVRGYLLDLLAGLGVDPVVSDELTSLPGVEELAALLALGEHAAAGEHDLIVVDCAPTAETLRLLTLPEILRWHLGRLMPAQRRLLSTIGPAAASASGLRLPRPEVVSVLLTCRERLGTIHDLLTGARSSVRIVLTPERMVVAEARRLLTSLSVHGYSVDGVVVNRVMPDGDDPWRRSWTVSQRQGLLEVAGSFTGIPITTLPYAPNEPIGSAALAALYDSRSVVAGTEPELTAPVVGTPMRVGPDGPDFVLRLAAPFATSRDVTVARREDDLIITVGDDRRVIALPSVLRRCMVKNASVGHGELKVRFERDPAEWPA